MSTASRQSMRWEGETSYGRSAGSFGQARRIVIVKWKVKGWGVHIWCDESDPVARADPGAEKAIAKVLYALCPGRGTGFGCGEWERVDGKRRAVDAPDGIRVDDRMLHVGMYNGELVGIYLCGAKKES